MDRQHAVRTARQSIGFRRKNIAVAGRKRRVALLPLLALLLSGAAAAAGTAPANTAPGDDCKTAAHYYYAVVADGDKTAQARLQQMQAQGRCYPGNYNDARALYLKEVGSSGSVGSNDELSMYMAEVLCHASQSFSVPASDQAPAAMQDSLKHCDSPDLYYGLKGAVDYTRARWCAIHEMKANTGSLLGGPAVLMMVYANGQGVARNWPLATHLACEAGGAPAELEGRIAHLQTLQAGKKPYPKIDFCDDITSGLMQGFCEGLGSTRAAYQRDQHLEQLTQRLSPDAAQRLRHLRQVAKQFFATQSGNEVDLSGTNRAASETEQSDADWKAFAADVDQVVSGRLAAADAGKAAQADAALNAAYQRLMKSPALQPSKENPTVFSAGDTTIMPGGVRLAQRAWLKYRDAWTLFATAVDPALRDAILVKITNERTSQLNQVLQDAGGNIDSQ